MKLDNRQDESYKLGVAAFLNFAYSGKAKHLTIACPCKQCNNFCNHTKSVVENHLFTFGIRKSYTMVNNFDRKLERIVIWAVMKKGILTVRI